MRPSLDQGCCAVCKIEFFLLEEKRIDTNAELAAS